jgi:hypothetical protein
MTAGTFHRTRSPHKNGLRIKPACRRLGKAAGRRGGRDRNAGSHPSSRACAQVRPQELAHQGGSHSGGDSDMIQDGKNQPAAARNLISPFPFPLRGKAGAGGFPPRRARWPPANCAGTHRCCGSPRKRDFKTLRRNPPCAIPLQTKPASNRRNTLPDQRLVGYNRSCPE